MGCKTHFISILFFWSQVLKDYPKQMGLMTGPWGAKAPKVVKTPILLSLYQIKPWLLPLT